MPSDDMPSCTDFLIFLFLISMQSAIMNYYYLNLTNKYNIKCLTGGRHWYFLHENVFDTWFKHCCLTISLRSNPCQLVSIGHVSLIAILQIISLVHLIFTFDKVSEIIQYLGQFNRKNTAMTKLVFQF